MLLTGGEIDQAAGLLTLRERQPFALHATAETFAALADNPMFGALDPAIVSRRVIVAGREHSRWPASTLKSSRCRARYRSISKATIRQIEESGVTIGVEIGDGDARLIFVPGAAAMTPALRRRLQRAKVVLFDGTLFTDDEMIASGTGTKTGRRMGHMPIEGPDGSLAALADLPGRNIFIHVNNTNPILIDGSPQRRRVEAAGFEVAFDGMEIVV